jgi:hypothetical protein
MRQRLAGRLWHGTAPALASVLGLAFAATPSDSDWTGRYTAGEVAGPMMTMSYTIDVFRGADGAWRALFAADGHMTLQRLIARAEPRDGALVLTVLRAGPDHMPDPPAAGQLIATLARAVGGFQLRFPADGSLLNSAATLPARRAALPPWAGRYTFRHCPRARECWTCAVDVALGEEGWIATLEVDAAGKPQRLRARGEEGERVSVGPYLQLGELALLVRGRDGSMRLRFEKLAAPPGVQELSAEPSPR